MFLYYFLIVFPQLLGRTLFLFRFLSDPFTGTVLSRLTLLSVETERFGRSMTANTYVWNKEFCVESNGTGVSQNLFQFQTTKCVAANFVCHTSVHCCKDSSGLSLSSVVTVFLKPPDCTCSQRPEHPAVPVREAHRHTGTTSLVTWSSFISISPPPPSSGWSLKGSDLKAWRPLRP